MFYKEGDKYYPNSTELFETIPSAVYMCKYNDRKWCIESMKFSDNFKLPNIIESEEDVIFKSLVIDDFKKCDKNLGILLTGIKGTGKTIIAERICNELKIPVFVLTELLPKNLLEEFFKSLNQKCIVFIDEYDKEYGSSDTLLSIMDGALSPEHPVLFLLTSNELEINKNMLNRPNRIKYIRNYIQLELDFSINLVREKVNNLSRAEIAVQLIEKFDTLTFDVLLNFIDTINNHEHIAVVDIFKFLNITKKEKNSFGFGHKK